MLNKIYSLLVGFRKKLGEKGQGMVEYALILAAVAIIAVVAIWGTSSGEGDSATRSGGLKDAVTGAFTKATTAINEANAKVDAEKEKKSGT